MYIYNTTHLSEQTIRLIASIVKPPDIPEVRSISLRNKQEGKIKGNWGYFYSHEYRITLCVPKYLSDYTADCSHTGYSVLIKDHNDFLAVVLGHEYFHAWQWHHERETYNDKDHLEYGAEEYEPIALGLWNDWKRVNKYQEEIKKIGKRVNYKDFR